MRIFLVLFCALALQACALPTPPAPSDNYVAPDFTMPARGALIVLLPPKTTTPQAIAGGAFVVAQLHKQLTQSGYKVVALDPDNHALIWEQEVSAVGGIYDPADGQLKTAAYGKALAGLAQRIAADTKAVLVISHSILGRPAAVSGTKAIWDGQSRTLPVAKTFGSEFRISTGTSTALSVELLGIAGGGQVVFKTYGGIAVPYRANMAGEKYELRPDLFANDGETADGVRLALAPWLRN